MRMSGGSIESTGDEVYPVEFNDGVPGQYTGAMHPWNVEEEIWPELGYFGNERFEPPEKR